MLDLKIMFGPQIQQKWDHFFNQNVKYSLCVIDFFNKYAWLKPLKDEKKLKQFFYAIIEAVNKSNHKPNKLQVDQEKRFCNSFI